MTVLETQRLILRPFKASDFEDVHHYSQDPEVTRYQSWGPNSETDTREFIRVSSEAFETPNIGDFELAIVLRSSDSVIGGCGLHERRKAFREYETGWTLSKSHWRHGIGTEAVSALIDFAASQLEAHRVYAEIVQGRIGCNYLNLLRSWRLARTMQHPWREVSEEKRT